MRSSPCLAARGPGAGIGLATLREGATVSLDPDGAGRIEVHADEGSPVLVCTDHALDPALRVAADPGHHSPSDERPATASAPRATRRRFVALGRGLAVMLFARPADLSPAPLDATGWTRLRHRLREDAGQVGCLKRLAPWTALFDRPDGEPVGLVVDGSIPYGKWGFVRTASSGWAELRVNLGFGPFKLWLRDGPADWCP